MLALSARKRDSLTGASAGCQRMPWFPCAAMLSLSSGAADRLLAQAGCGLVVSLVCGD